MTEASPVTISFVVPARNEERFIGACIDALRAQNLEERFEIVVVDNGSTDATRARALECGVKVVREPAPGLANARQAGAEAAAGELLVFIDADTRLPVDWTRTVLRRFADDAELVALSPGFSFYDGRRRDAIGGLFFRALLCPLVDLMLQSCGRPGVLVGSAMAIRADALRRAKGVDLDFQFYGEDTALACRLHSEGVVRFSRGPVYATSARRYRERGLLPVVSRYFSIFALIQLGRRREAWRLAHRFQAQDRGDWRGRGARSAVPWTFGSNERNLEREPSLDHVILAETASPLVD